VSDFSSTDAAAASAAGTRPRLGVIGSGSIVPFHLDAALAAGFSIAGIGSRAGSEKTAALAERYSAPALADWHEVLERAGRGEFDALLIAAETSATRVILAEAMGLGLPILVEKPGAYSSAELEPLVTKPGSENVLVGYNRRHYSSTAAAKKMIDATEGVTFHASIPEASWTVEMPAEKKREILLSNTVHVLDLLRFLFGDIDVASVVGTDDEFGILSRAIIFAPREGGAANLGSAIVTFGSPSNYFIDIHSAGRSAALRPIEFYREFDSVKVIDPTPELPLRHYVPTEVGEFVLAQADVDFKPGFLSQFEELLSLVEAAGGSGVSAAEVWRLRENFKSASLADAVAVLQIAEQLL
jgi:predicted dehydrogenase